MLLLIVAAVAIVIFLLTGNIGILVGHTGLLVTAVTGFLLLFLFMGVNVAAALAAVALLVDPLFSERSLSILAGQLAWGATANFVLVAVPLFVLMGELLLRSGLTDRLYRALSVWMNPLPGGLLHSNIVACSLFAAVCGSSAATAATIGAVALPAFRQKRYSERLVVGSLAAGGTLGILIPPSMKMIWYALLTDNSVGRLFLAGVIPGVTLAGLFMLVIALIAWLYPQTAPKEPTVPWKDKVRELVWVGPIGALIIVVLGSIYGGLATPTEAAALGVTASLILAACFRRLSLQMLNESIEATARITAMVVLILICAEVFNFIIGALDLPNTLASSVANLQVSPLMILSVIVLFYIVAGTFLDDVALTFATIPVIYPVIQKLAAQNPKLLIFDGVAFGILFVVLMEMAIISPPDGINLYVIQGLRGGGSMNDVFIGVMPFFLCMMILIVLLIAFPQIALWLPNKAFSP